MYAQQRGTATQGGQQQYLSQLQNSYYNAVNQQNANFNNQVLTNTALQDKATTSSNNAFNSYSDAVSQAVSEGTLTQDRLNELQQRYYESMNDEDLRNAKTFTEGVAGTTDNSYSTDIENPKHYSYSLGNENVEIDFGKDNNVGRNFTISIGNEKVNVQLGKNITNDFSELTNSMKIGEIRQITYNGNQRMAIKDTDGNLRIIANRGSGSGVGFNRVLARWFGTNMTGGLNWLGSNQENQLQQAYNNAKNS